MRALIISLFAFLLPLMANADQLDEERNDAAAYYTKEIGRIAGHYSLAGPHHVVIFGDSNTDRFWWNTTAGGCRIINAGFGQGRPRQLSLLADYVASTTMPNIVHIMVGTNLVALDPDESPQAAAEWASLPEDLDRIAQAFKSRGAKLVFWPVPPFASGLPKFTLAKQAAVNNQIALAASRAGALYDWWWPSQISDSAGYALSTMVIGDGIHLTGQAQISRFYRIQTWSEYIQANYGVGCN